ncbi:MAG: CRTAC1 family protein [Acidobacteriota bacterium]
MTKVILAISLLSTALAAQGSEISPEALRLRNEGLAGLENEQPKQAEEAFLQLSTQVPSDPLPWADLAIARLRQQEFDAAEEALATALKLSPEDPRLLSIRAEILQWSGSPEEALALLRRAAEAAPEDVAIQYALWRQASGLSGSLAEEAGREAIPRLTNLRPDNLLVLLQQVQQAIASGDRSVATGAILRIREVIWQAPAAAQTLLDQISEALEEDRVADARVPALRLENVLKITPMYKEGLRELSPGIQGIPLVRFRNEPVPTSFGKPVEIRFESEKISATGTAGKALATADFDGDGTTDWARLVTTGTPGLEVRLSSSPELSKFELPITEAERLLIADLDNDGYLDILVFGPSFLEVFRSSDGKNFVDATGYFGLDSLGAAAVAPIDFDIEGDLDLALAGGKSSPAELLQNNLDGPLLAVGDRSLPSLDLGTVHDLIATDLDRDGDVDLVIAHDGGLVWLDNRRQGTFADRTGASGLDKAGPAQAVVSADLDNDGMPDLITAGHGVDFLHNVEGRFEPWSLGKDLDSRALFTSLIAFDADNDGTLDLAVAGAEGLVVMTRSDDGSLAFVKIANPPRVVSALAAGDLDGDCDLDLLAANAEGLFRLENQGGESNNCLQVRLVGLNKGNSKNNIFGVGATIEVRAGEAYQFREVDSDSTHLGLGTIAVPDLMRVVWTNGVPQNRLQPEADQRIVEEQVVKGSCPFLYTWNGKEIAFVTDLLWGAPAGLPVAAGQWASADPEELVEIEGAEPKAGVYDLRITEELWEAAFFDLTRLWVVDHPADVEVASSLRIVPGQKIDDRVLGMRDLKPVSAWTDDGSDVTQRLARRDEIYADAWSTSPYQGVAGRPWALELDLGQAPGRPIRLLLDAWIFPSDASLNLAVSQRHDLRITPPRLEMEIDGSWQPLVANMGHPAGKTKTMAVDTPELPEGVHRLRIVGTQWLSFDRIVWSAGIADDEPIVVDRLLPVVAELRFRGFSRQYRVSPNGPHRFDYGRTTMESPWLPFPGRYTRYGDVLELVADSDDRSVVMGPGDEMRLLFDVSDLTSPRKGWSRTVFLESHGWDKDADRNTWQAQQVEPLPFHAMSGYPFADGDRPPSGPSYQEYLSNWITREVVPVQGILPSRAP